MAVAERFADEGAAGSTWWTSTARSATARTWRSCAASWPVVGGRVRVQLGGGLRTVALVREGLEQGVTRAVIGTAAADRSGDRARRGGRRWARTASPWASTRATGGSRSAAGPRPPTSPPRPSRAAWSGEGVRTVVYTDIARDGMLTGPDLDGARRLQAAGAGVIASGGVAGAGDIRAAREAGLAGAIVGRALYEGRLTLAEALEAAAVRHRDDPPGRSSSSRSRPPWPRSPTSGSSGPAGAAGCRSPAARSPGPRSASCCSTSAVPLPAPLRRPLVLLDASLSLAAPGGRWREARDSAARWGDVRRFGDERGSDRHASRPAAARCSRPRSPRRRRRTGRSSSSPTARSRTRATSRPISCSRSACGSFLAPPVPTWRSRA